MCPVYTHMYTFLVYEVLKFMQFYCMKMPIHKLTCLKESKSCSCSSSKSNKALAMGLSQESSRLGSGLITWQRFLNWKMRIKDDTQQESVGVIQHTVCQMYVIIFNWNLLHHSIFSIFLYFDQLHNYIQVPKLSTDTCNLQ